MAIGLCYVASDGGVVAFAGIISHDNFLCFFHSSEKVPL